MVKNINIKGLHIKFAFRHYWEKDKGLLERRANFNTKQFGIFFRRDMCVGYGGTRPSYMFGIQLGWIKAWMTIDYKVMHFKID